MQLTVGEDEAVDERAPGPRRRRQRDRPAVGAAGRTADAVVEQPSLRDQQLAQVAEVLAEAPAPDVLEHADGADGVERAVVDVAVVLQPDVDLAGQPGVLHPLDRGLDLAGRDGHADDLDPVVLARRAGPSNPSRSPRPTAASRGAGPASGTPARAWPPARPRARPTGPARRRRSTSSTDRASAGRSRWTGRSGRRWPPHRARASGGRRACGPPPGAAAAAAAPPSRPAWPGRPAGCGRRRGRCGRRTPARRTGHRRHPGRRPRRHGRARGRSVR